MADVGSEMNSEMEEQRRETPSTLTFSLQLLVRLDLQGPHLKSPASWTLD